MFRNTMIAAIAALAFSTSAMATGGWSPFGSYTVPYSNSGSASGGASAASAGSTSAAGSSGNGAASASGGAHQSSTGYAQDRSSNRGVGVRGVATTSGGANSDSGAIGNAGAENYSAASGVAVFGAGGGFENGTKTVKTFFGIPYKVTKDVTSQGSAEVGGYAEGSTVAETGAAYFGIAGAHGTNDAGGSAAAHADLTRGGVDVGVRSAAHGVTSAHDYDIGIAYGNADSDASGDAGAGASASNSN